jgi:hypothetical protein
VEEVGVGVADGRTVVEGKQILQGFTCCPFANNKWCGAIFSIRITKFFTIAKNNG